jgi:hypothetical protein
VIQGWIGNGRGNAAARSLHTAVAMKSLLTILPAALALALTGCLAETADDMDEDAAAFDDAVTSCKGPFDCKLPNTGAANANRATNPQNGTDDWPIKAGTVLYNGFGQARGVITAGTVNINYGQRKVIGGTRYVYAFAVPLDNGKHASGWVIESQVTANIGSMPTVSAKNPGKGDYQTIFTVTGGDPAVFGDLKVAPNYTGSNVAATDYLKRDGDVFNLLYNLPGVGGVSTDTLPIGTHFHRSLGVLAVDLPLYNPGSSKVVRTMRFVYGHVGTRYGWIARDAVQ